MSGRFIVAAASTVLFVSACSQPAALKTAAKRLGAAQVGTMEVCATGLAYARSAGTERAVYDVSNFVVSADYTESSGRLQITRRQRFEPGTLHPFPGEERADRFVAEGYAWDVQAPQEGITGAVPTTQAQQPAMKERLAEIWIYPQAFVRAAMKHNAKTKTTERGTEVAFTADDIEYLGTIDEDGNVVRVQSWTTGANQALVHFDAIYSDYRDYHGIRFPRHIVRNRDGQRELDLTVCSLNTGSAFEIFVPKAVQMTAQAEEGREASSG